MGCIEILLDNGKVTAIVKFNRNMGCIEIHYAEHRKDGFFRLIETWDVLKSITNCTPAFLTSV